jgi:hypothetical protein
MLRFIEDVVNPYIVEKKNRRTSLKSLIRFCDETVLHWQKRGRVSGYPIYLIEPTSTEHHPADELISEVLASFDEAGVHEAWQKALERRSSDPEGAITSAKTLLETVCKHILEDCGSTYGENEDLPKLYHLAAEHLNLAPSQHTEAVFKVFLATAKQS